MMNLSNHTFLFYDIETTGLNPCFDQILQFAAIRTDHQLNEIERHEFQVKLNPDVIPSPGAVITHQIGIQELQKGMTELDAIKKIHTMFNTPHTITLGYNTLGFDDEFLRFSFFRNLLPPYTHQYANQCFRMDLYPMTIMYYLFKNEAILWPTKNNKVNLKLANLSELNNLAVGQAHNAMVDVEATLALARRFFQHTEMWQYVCAYFIKSIDQERMSKLDNHALMVHGKIGSDLSYLAPVMSLGWHNHYKNQCLWLRLDDEKLSSASLETIADSTFSFRKKMGEELFLLPYHEKYLTKIHPDRLKKAEENKSRLQNNKNLLQAIKDYHINYQYPKHPQVDIDAALYELDFPTYAEERLFSTFHQAEPQRKALMLDHFSNSKRQAQAIRILGRYYPDLLPEKHLNLFNEYLAKNSNANENLFDYKGHAKLTAKKALAEIEELQRSVTLTATQIQLTEDLKQYLQQKA